MAQNYENGCATYPVLGEVELTKKNGLVVIEDLGISAQALSIGGNPVAFDGTMYCSPQKVVHEPTAYKAGLLRLEFKA